MKKWVVIGMVVTMALGLAINPPAVRAQSMDVLYFVDDERDGNLAKIYRVELDLAKGIANLTPLPPVGSLDPGEVPFSNVFALACTPDGKKLYMIDMYHWGTGKLGYYEVGTAAWFEIGEVKYKGSIVAGIVLAGFSPDGTLYVASQWTDSLYIVDTGTAEATLVGEIVNQATGVTVDAEGGDLVFAADGTLYLWANRARVGAPRGLYILPLPPATPGTVEGIYLGTIVTEPFFSGLAIRELGTGDLVGSYTKDEFIVFDRSTVGTVATLKMYLGGTPFDHQGGDMSVGPLMELCTRTIGYWKNHAWCGRTVTICGITVNEDLGKKILWGARGNNFSMFFAQLIAAKLNCGDCVGIPVIDDAAWWLCQQPDIVSGGTLNWSKSFDSKEQKSQASSYWEALDDFNNEYECEEEDKYSVVAGQGPGAASYVRDFGALKGSLWTTLKAFGAGNFNGEVSVDIGDVTGEGIPEIVVGQRSMGASSFVRVFTQNGILLWTFQAFGAGNTNGMVNVAVGDVDGDDVGEIIVGQGPGGQSYVRVFEYKNSTPVTTWKAFGPGNVSGEVRVAAGRTRSGASVGQIITGQGHGGASYVRVWDFATSKPALYKTFKAFGPGNTSGGVDVGVGCFDGDSSGRDLIVVGQGGPGETTADPAGSYVRVFTETGVLLKTIKAFGSQNTSGRVTVSGGQVDKDAADEIIVGTAVGGNSCWRAFNLDGSFVRVVKAFGLGNISGQVDVAGVK